MSDSVRRIRLHGLWLRKDDRGTHVLTGRTQSEARYEIVLTDLTISDAQCAISKLAEFIGETIESERRHHDFVRRRVSDASSRVRRATEQQA
ncbi:MAG: hypothetical protein NXI31_11505 [bacterium]|nr:hypothetical protein [bacterium]